MPELDSNGLWLAQGVPAPGEGTPVTGEVAADPAGNGDGGGRPAGGPDLLLPLLALMIVVIIASSFFGQRRERKKREALISAIKKHDKVQTIGGVVGTIVEINSDTVRLKVDESSNTRITFARSAVQQVLESRDGESIRREADAKEAPNSLEAR